MSTYAVTGTSSGIGLALVRQLTERGDEVFAFCRRPSESLRRSGARLIERVELEDPESIVHGVAALGGLKIDVLISNAGVWSLDKFGHCKSDALHHQYAINAVAPLLLVQAMRNNLGFGSKVMLVSSRMGSVGDNSMGSRYGYRMSKSALNAAGKSLAIDLKEDGIAVGIVHPGYVKTDMTGQRGQIDADESASMILERLEALTLDNAGRFLHADGSELPW